MKMKKEDLMKAVLMSMMAKSGMDKEEDEEDEDEDEDKRKKTMLIIVGKPEDDKAKSKSLKKMSSRSLMSRMKDRG